MCSAKERDDSTGFYYHGARYFAPWMGRWMSADPAGPVDGVNLYQYVSGNPVRKKDSSGMGEDDADNTMVFAPEEVFSNQDYSEYMVEGGGAEEEGELYLATGQSIDSRQEDVSYAKRSASAAAGYTDSFIQGITGTIAMMGAPDGRSLMVSDPKVRAANERAFQLHTELSAKTINKLSIGPVKGAEAEYEAGHTTGVVVQLVIAVAGLAKLAYNASNYAKVANAVKEVAEEAPVLAETSLVGQSSTARELASTFDDLTAAAERARTAIGPGKGPVYGTKAHSAFKSEVEALGIDNLKTEVSYLNGKIVPYGTKGSVRLDVVEGALDAPTAVFDLKTGNATLTPSRIKDIRSHLPGGGINVPVMEIR